MVNLYNESEGNSLVVKFINCRTDPRDINFTILNFMLTTNSDLTKLRFRIRGLLTFFIVALVLSGLTAFPLQWELELLARMLGAGAADFPDQHGGLTHWIVTVRNGLQDTYARHSFLAYGTDWLAFAHIVIAIFFVGPLIDPVRNEWIITAGMIACLLVPVLAFVCGPIRGIPFYWQLIDSSFGVFGFIPLWYCRKAIRQLADLSRQSTPVRLN